MHFRGILPCIFEGVWQTPDNPLAGEHALRNLQRIAPCERCTSRLLRSPRPSPPGAAGTNPSLKALGTTSAPPDFSTPRIAYGRSAVMGNTYTSFSRS